MQEGKNGKGKNEKKIEQKCKNDEKVLVWIVFLSVFIWCLVALSVWCTVGPTSVTLHPGMTTETSERQSFVVGVVMVVTSSWS